MCKHNQHQLPLRLRLVIIYFYSFSIIFHWIIMLILVPWIKDINWLKQNIHFSFTIQYCDMFDTTLSRINFIENLWTLNIYVYFLVNMDTWMQIIKDEILSCSSKTQFPNGSIAIGKVITWTMMIIKCLMLPRYFHGIMCVLTGIWLLERK